jgi:protein TonB
VKKALCWLAFAMLLQAQVSPMWVAPVEQKKRLLHQVGPVYPKLAYEARIQGTVRLLAVIDETGFVDNLKLISGHPLLVKAAMDAAKQWRYLPALRKGFAVPVRTTIEITFRLWNNDAERTGHIVKVRLDPRRTL